MLKFYLVTLAHVDPRGWVRQPGGRWINGRSWIEPFSSPALESGIHVDSQCATIVVRERIRGEKFPGPFAGATDGCGTARPAELDRAHPKADHLVLRIERESVSIRAGEWGVAPLYVVAANDSLYGSWDYLDHRDHLRVGDLVDREVVGHLTLRLRYSSRTLFGNVCALTERAHLSWQPGNPPAVKYPKHAVHYRPRELRDPAPVVDAYGTALRAAIEVRDIDIEDVMIEVSGGTDSATVALAARSALGPGRLASYGLLVGGPAGAQQVMRRASVVRLANLSDTTVDADRYPPLAPEDLINPIEEPYGAAVTAAAQQTGRAVVLTGIGGDELFALRADERGPGGPSVRPLPLFLTRTASELAHQLEREPLEAPVSVIPETALRACRVRAPLFLRLGCWPVAPLCSPDLIRFGEWMPRTWREGKRLPRTWLVNQGVPSEVAWPSLRENFLPIMQDTLRRHGIPQLRAMLAEGSLLIDRGYLDPDALATMTREAETARDSGGLIDDHLHEVVSLERGLRTLLHM